MGLFQSHGRCGRGDGAAFELSQHGGRVTNQNVYWIAGSVFAAFLLDLGLNGGAASLFLLLKLLDLMEFVMFWR